MDLESLLNQSKIYYQLSSHPDKWFPVLTFSLARQIKQSTNGFMILVDFLSVKPKIIRIKCSLDFDG